MTYAAFETSTQLGTPVELYEFIQGLQRWYYITGTEPITRLGQVYTPAPISRDQIKQAEDPFQNDLSFEFPRDDAFASQFLGFAPDTVTTVTVMRGHYGDADAEYVVYWKGRVTGAKVSGNTINVDCESVFTSIRRPGLRAKYELGCRRTLYAKGCNVNRELYKLSGAVLSISAGITISVSGAGSQPAGYYTGGILTTPSGASRFIAAHTSDQVTLTRTIPDLVGGVVVTIYPGCDHLLTTCHEKFNNLPNNGSFPHIPKKNPMGGSSIV